MGFSVNGGGRWGGGRQGLTATKMTGVNLNYEKKDRLKLDGSIRWNHSDVDAVVRRSTESFMSSSISSFGNNNSKNMSRTNSWDARMRIEWMPDSMWNILFRPQFRYNSNDGLGDSDGATFRADPYKFNVTDPLAQIDKLIYTDSIVKNWNMDNSLTYSDSKTVGGVLQINRKLSNNGRNVTLRLSGNYSEGISRSMTNNFVEYFIVDSTKTPREYLDSTYQANRYAVTPTKNWDYTIRTTYSEPIFRQTYLQFSYQFQYSAQNSDRATYNMSDALAATWGMPDWIYEDNDLIRDDKLSTNSFYYNYDQTAQIQFRKNATDQSYNFTVGLSVLPQYSKMNYSGMGVTDTLLERTVFNWTPTVQFRYRVTRQEQINIRYNGRSSQPQMSQLLDIRDDSNPLRVSSGNPNLLPTFNNQLSLGYQKYNPVTMGSFNVNTSVSNTLRQIQNKTTLLANGGTESRPENMDGFWANWNANASIMYNYTFPDDRYSIMTNTSGNFSHQEGWASIVGQEAQLRKTNTTGANESLSAEYRDDYLTISLDGSLRYQHSTNDLQPDRNMDTYDFSYGTSFMAYIPWRNMRLGSDLNMNSRRGYDAEMNTDELIWNASLSFSFLKGNKASLSLAAYDILHQRSTVSRSMSATSRTDTENKNITSYFMATLTYRLSLMGDRNSRQQLRGRGGMGGFGGGMGGFGGGMGGGFGGGFGGGMGGGMMF
jgi:hypothetical protein